MKQCLVQIQILANGNRHEAMTGSNSGLFSIGNLHTTKAA